MPYPHAVDVRSEVGRTLIRIVRVAAAYESRSEIRLIENDSGRWSAVDEGTGVASQGETREDALENLDEAVALHKDEIGEPVTDDAFWEWGIEPETVPDEPREPDAPWFDE